VKIRIGFLTLATLVAVAGADASAQPSTPTYQGVLTFATTGNGDPFHPTIVQDLDLASGQLTVRFDGLDATRSRSGELAFLQRLAPGVYADHGVVVVDARGVPGAPVFICKSFRVSDNRTCAAPKLAPSGRLVAFVAVGSGTVCDGGYGMKWGSFVVVTDRRGAELARFEGYSFPEWLPDGRLLMMGTQCRRGGIWLTDASLRSIARVDGDQVNTPASAPAASPNGRTLAFVWNNQLWALTLTGRPELTQLTALQKPVTSAAWSPDGSSLAALMFDVTMPVRSLALFRPGDQKSLVFRALGVYPYGPISWR
jgi:Tol biopolymer transport system component